MKEIYKNLIKSEDLHESYQVTLKDSILYVHDPLEIIERMRNPDRNTKTNLVALGFRGIVAVSKEVEMENMTDFDHLF